MLSLLAVALLAADPPRKRVSWEFPCGSSVVTDKSPEVADLERRLEAVNAELAALKVVAAQAPAYNSARTYRRVCDRRGRCYLVEVP